MSRVSPDAAAWLGLAASPTFAAMALATALQASGASLPLCGPAAPDPSPLSGMTLMYLLMSGFHLGPWLKRARSN